MPGAGRTRKPRGLKRKDAHKSSGKAETIRHSLRNGLRLTSRSRRSTGLVSLRPPGALDPGVDPSLGGPRPHDLTVRIGHASPAHLRVHRSPHHES